MTSQIIYLNASITLSKLPTIMQTQIRAANMRWGGTTLKSLQPCLMPMPNTTICHSWLSHYNCQTEMWWPNFKTVQIEIGLSEYGGNKKAVRTDGLLTKHQNWENAKTIFFSPRHPKRWGCALKTAKGMSCDSGCTNDQSVELQYIRVLSTI